MGRVIVVGSANVDLVWHGDRLPHPGETVTDGKFTQVLGGKGANQAAAAAALGADVEFIGSLGHDEHGAVYAPTWRPAWIGVDRVATVDDATGVAVILVDSGGENVVAVAPGANARLAPAAVQGVVRPDDTVLVSCEIPVVTVEAAVGAAHSVGATVIVNPAPPRALIGGAILTPNEHECMTLGGIDALLAARPVIVTQGAHGAMLHRPVGRRRQAPFSAAVVDTTGAGDAFNGALAWALADGKSLAEALVFACAAGALATRALGARASLATVDEIYALATA